MAARIPSQIHFLRRRRMTGARLRSMRSFDRSAGAFWVIADAQKNNATRILGAFCILLRRQQWNDSQRLSSRGGAEGPAFSTTPRNTLQPTARQPPADRDGA